MLGDLLFKVQQHICQTYLTHIYSQAYATIFFSNAMNTYCSASPRCNANLHGLEEPTIESIAYVTTLVGALALISKLA